MTINHRRRQRVDDSGDTCPIPKRVDSHNVSDTGRTPAEILAAAESIMAHPVTRVEVREGIFARRADTAWMWDRFPKLFAMCCEACRPEEVSRVRSTLGMMLEAMQAPGPHPHPVPNPISSEDKDVPPPHPATPIVHAALKEMYLDPVIAAADAAAEPAGRANSYS